MERKPTHPGEIIREDYLKPLAITITEFASVLGEETRGTLSVFIEALGCSVVGYTKAQGRWLRP
jgi:plasmid maintenance system antidote protein VapI